MIISYRHKFTFLHVPKTAGSSMNVALLPHLGPLDIVLGSEKERTRANAPLNLRARVDALQVRNPLSVFAAAGIGAGWRRRVLQLQTKSYLEYFGPKVDHPSAEQVRSFDQKAWDRHFKFTFVRNPYERMASLYLFLARKAQPTVEQFSAFVQQLIDGTGDLAGWRHLADAWPVYSIGDRVVVDFVGRFEQLDVDFKFLCDYFDLPHPELGQAKAAPRYDFRELYEVNTRKLVQRLCEREIECFGYQF